MLFYILTNNNSEIMKAVYLKKKKNIRVLSQTSVIQNLHKF
jgi:hypothetical protein